MANQDKSQQSSQPQQAKQASEELFTSPRNTNIGS